MAILGLTSLTGCNSIPDFIETGTPMVFHQTTAPTSWTKSTTHDNKALRVVNGTITTGGSSPFTSILNGSVSAHTLSTSEIPSHSHSYARGNRDSPNPDGAGLESPSFTGATSNSTGGTGSHTHGMDVAYVDIIIATKN
jgi:microcystin-dependent protein